MLRIPGEPPSHRAITAPTTKAQVLAPRLRRTDGRASLSAAGLDEVDVEHRIPTPRAAATRRATSKSWPRTARRAHGAGPSRGGARAGGHDPLAARAAILSAATCAPDGERTASRRAADFVVAGQRALRTAASRRDGCAPRRARVRSASNAATSPAGRTTRGRSASAAPAPLDRRMPKAVSAPSTESPAETASAGRYPWVTATGPARLPPDRGGCSSSQKERIASMRPRVDPPVDSPHRRDAASVTRLFDARGQRRVRSSHRDDDDLLARAARAVGVGAGVAPGTNKLVYALEAATRSVAERLGLLRPTGVAHRRSDDGPPAVAVRRSARARTSGWSGRVSSGCSPRCRSRSTDRPGTSCPCSPCRRSRRP